MSTTGTTELAPVPEGNGTAMDAGPRMTIAGVSGEVDFTADMPEFSSEVQSKLLRKVNPEHVELRQDKLLYVPWVHYQDVLVDAFGLGGYRMVPLERPRQQGQVMTWHMALMVRPPGQSKFFYVKSAVGECAVNSGMTTGNACEGAQSDALTKACKHLRIFNELFDPGWRRWWETEFKAAHLRNRPQRPGETPAPKAPAGAATAAGANSDTQEAHASASGISPPTGSDPGEPVGAEAAAAIRAEVKRLKFRPSYARLWLKDMFGVESPDSLTRMQAETALPLLQAHGTGMYNALVQKMEAQGRLGARP